MENLVRWMTQGVEQRSGTALSFSDWASWFSYGNTGYPFTPNTTLGHTEEQIEQSFDGYVEQMYKKNSVVFACMNARQLLFSEARFQFQALRASRPGELFGTPELQLLEVPWVNATTGDLLARMIQDTDLAGNFFAVRDGRIIRRVRPDWMTIVLGSKRDVLHPSWQLDADVIGYLYHPGGHRSGAKPETLLPEQVAHFAPTPDPTARYRGMSWLQTVVREVMADSAATTHKLMFFEQGATPNLAVSLSPEISPQVFKEWIEVFADEHEGVMNAYKTLYLGGGADVKVVGADMEQLDFKVTQGAGETRIAAAAGIPAILVGLSEGLEASTYSNYAQARRHFGDARLRPLWRNAAGSLASIIRVPGGSRLWYDDRDIPFLKEDVKDAAEIQQKKAVTARELINAGFEPASVVDYIESDDMTRLKHTGLVSVQLQPPGSLNPAPSGTNGGAPHLPPAKKSQ